ncbi:hypothetical protein ACIRPU_42430 [Streptomyces sp. NPDC102259]|uniref:competence protein CoiA family protein n=1 Tax=Streptomyces sp. NPDC102259 TaxID=3366148 RepID=UPI0037F4F38E
MATWPDGSRRVALEAQMASISIADIEARTDRYGEAGVEVRWFTDRKTAPWLDNVPSVQIARPDDGGPVQVTAGAARFEPQWCDNRTVCDWCDCEDCGAGVDGPLPWEGHGKWEPAAPFPLERFVAAVCQNATRPHRLRVGWDTKGKRRWITRRYFDMEEEQLQAHIRKYQIVERLQTVQQRQQNARQATEQEHLAAIEALLQRQKALIKPVTEFIYHEAGTYPSVARDASPEFAMGVPVHGRGKTYAVICPVASRVPALRRRLALLVLFAASERERSRILARGTRSARRGSHRRARPAFRTGG